MRLRRSRMSLTSQWSLTKEVRSLRSLTIVLLGQKIRFRPSRVCSSAAVYQPRKRNGMV